MLLFALLWMVLPGFGPQHPPHPPPARPLPINFIRDITAVDKNHLKNQQCQLDGRFSYKSIAIHCISSINTPRVLLFSCLKSKLYVPK